MQSKIYNKVQFGQALNPVKNVAKVSSINDISDLQDIFKKKSISLRNYGTMVVWIMILSDTYQVWRKYQDRDKSIVYTCK